MDGINFHYKEGAIMNVILFNGYIYLIELLLLKDKTLSKYLKNNKTLFESVLKYDTFNEILEMYPRFGYTDEELLDILDINMLIMDVDLYERLKDHFGFNGNCKMNFGKSQVLDFSQFKKTSKGKVRYPTTPIHKPKTQPSAFISLSSTVFEEFIDKQTTSKMTDSENLIKHIKHTKPPLFPNNNAQRPMSSHGKI